MRAPGATPDSGATHDPVVGLPAWLQISRVASKNVALDELIRLLHKDDKNALIAAAHGAVPTLVCLLDLPCLEAKEKVVALVSRISSIEVSLSPLGGGCQRQRESSSGELALSLSLSPTPPGEVVGAGASRQVGN